MIVALDMQLARGTSTGIGEYARGLAGALRACGTGVIELDEPKLDPWRFDRRIIWDQVVLPKRARASGADLLHCTSGTMPLCPGLPALVTVHDVAWLKVQQHTRPYARYYFGSFSLQRYRRAAAIVVDSAFSKRELLSVIDTPHERVQVIYPGVAADYGALRRAAKSDPFVLVPGTLEPRKNLEVLIRAVAEIPGVKVISTGPFTPYRRDCQALARQMGIQDRVELRGYVERSELLDLYARCALVAVPSRYEGFGYAAAQALCAGTPLIVSDQASLPEVAGNDVAIVPVDDATAWASAIETILRDPRGAQQRANGVRDAALGRFSWEASARAMIEMYSSIA